MRDGWPTARTGARCGHDAAAPGRRAGLRQGLDVVCAALARSGRSAARGRGPGLCDIAVLAARLAGLEVIFPCPSTPKNRRCSARAAAADAVLVTPAHQFPTGVVLAPDRRRALLDWARDSGGLIIEDDYDAEFRHDGPPVGALQGLAPDHVVYVGTASKRSRRPCGSAGWPCRRAPEAAATAKWWRDSGSPAIEQLALADVLASGAFDRALRRALRIYRARRDRLAAELRRQVPAVRITGAAAGLHLVAHVPDADEDALVAAAAARGASVRGLSSYAVGSRCGPLPVPRSCSATAASRSRPSPTRWRCCGCAGRLVGHGAGRPSVARRRRLGLRFADADPRPSRPTSCRRPRAP